MSDVALVIGEALVDVVLGDGGAREHVGGSAANSAVALTRLGRPVWFATSYADDDRGRRIAEHLVRDGVEAANAPYVLPRTSTATATIADDGSANYDFDIEWRMAPVELPADAQPVVVYTSSLAAVLEPGCDDVVAECLRRRDAATVCYDVNARPMVTGVDAGLVSRVEALAAVCDLVKASDEDLAALYPDLGLDDAARTLLELGPAAVVVTLGGDGACWVSRRGSGRVAPVAVEVADTIGAGDTFGAALVDALWSAGLLGGDRRTALHAAGDDVWQQACEWAAAAAAVTVSRPGADPPRRAEVRRAP